MMILLLFAAVRTSRVDVSLMYPTESTSTSSNTTSTIHTESNSTSPNTTSTIHFLSTSTLRDSDEIHHQTYNENDDDSESKESTTTTTTTTGNDKDSDSKESTNTTTTTTTTRNSTKSTKTTTRKTTTTSKGTRKTEKTALTSARPSTAKLKVLTQSKRKEIPTTSPTLPTPPKPSKPNIEKKDFKTAFSNFTKRLTKFCMEKILEGALTLLVTFLEAGVNCHVKENVPDAVKTAKILLQKVRKAKDVCYYPRMVCKAKLMQSVMELAVDFTNAFPKFAFRFRELKTECLQKHFVQIACLCIRTIADVIFCIYKNFKKKG